MTTVNSSWLERSALLAGDLSAQQIDAMARSGQLFRFRPGRYAPGVAWARATEEFRHRIRAAEIAHALAGRAVVSHDSAALLLGLDLPGGLIPRVHVTWPGSPGRRSTSNITPHRGRLDGCDIIEVDGVLVTSPARTVFDVARLGQWSRAISVADSALRRRMCSSESMQDVVNRHARVPGAFRARKIIEFADGRAESVGESICRLRMAQLGLPSPSLQSAIPELADTLGSRVDFEFKQLRTVAEFDGKIKYGRLVSPGQQPGDVVFAEKVREDRIRETGRECVRIIWADLSRGEVLRARFAAAFRRAGFEHWSPSSPRFLVPNRLE